MAFKGEEIPKNCIHTSPDYGALNAPPVMEIPIIDLHLVRTGSTSAEELQKLRSALSIGGCFQAINHGITPEFLNQMREITRQYFHLPLEEKQKSLREDKNDIDGLVLTKKQALDWNDRLYLTIYPEDQRKLKFWPENPEAFRSILHEYSMKTKLVSEVILKAMARSLNLEESCFLDQYGKGAKLCARCNFYPPCPRPDPVVGFGPHSDGSAITLVLQDQSTEGLEFLIDNQWLRAPIIPEALLINVGDQVEISSNGIFKSSVHRVVTNSERERIALIVFYLPDREREIEPFEKLVNESRPRLYKKIKNYPEIYFEYYRQGKRTTEAAKLD